MTYKEYKDPRYVDTYKHQGMRTALAGLLHGKGIKDERVLRAIANIPRHFFLDLAFLDHAYQDKAFPIGEGQTISQPYTVAFQTEALEIKEGDKILEIGTGSGYQAAVLAEMGARLYSIEYQKKLFDKTSMLLKHTLGYNNIKLQYGDGSKGLPMYAPYNGIIVTAGSPGVPKDLVDQLAIGGHLIIPVGSQEEQSMLKITKTGPQQLTKKDLGQFFFVDLKGKNGWKG